MPDKTWLPNDGCPIPLKKLSNLMLTDILIALKVAAENKRRSTYALYRQMSGELESYGLRCCITLKDLTWKDYVEPIFHDLSFEANDRKLDWEEEPIDLNARGKLEKLIVGAIKDSIHSHGPVTATNVSSAAKRVIGVIKHFNKDIRDNARKDGLLASSGSSRGDQVDANT